MARYLLLIPLMILMLFAAAAGWIAGTSDGLRWAVETLSSRSGGMLSTGRTEGRLLDRATVQGVTITLGQQTIQIESLSLGWQPSGLLAGTIGIRELVIKNIRIQDNEPPSKEAPDLIWPRLPRIMDLFDLHISRLLLDRITYRHLNEQPLVISNIQSRIAWQEQRLSLQNLTLTTTQGSLTGKVRITFRNPSLETELAFVPVQPLAGMGRISIKTKFLQGKGEEQVAGAFIITGNQTQKQSSGELHLQGVAGITRNSINLRTMQLKVPDIQGRISADGSLVLTAAKPQLSLQLNLSSLNLEKLVKERTELSGTVKLKGTVTAYSGSFDLKNSGNKLHTGNLAGDFRGSDSEIIVQSFTGTALGGTVSGKLEAAWSDKVTLNGIIRGRKFNPAIIAQDWSGLVNVDISGSFAQSRSGEVSGKVNAILLDSTLHGQALTGKAAATIKGDNLLLERLQLQGKGFDLSASGELDKKLDFKARVSDLSRLLPKSGGALSAQGWVRLSNEKPGGAMTVTGRSLSMNKISIGSLQVAALLGEGKDYPLQLNADLNGIVYDNFRFSSATVKAEGTASSHRVKLTVKSAKAEARLTVSGAYTKNQWQGMINTASGRDNGGPWSLQAPSRLTVAKNSLSLSPLVIVTPGGERLELTINDLHYTPLTGRIAARWKQLNLSRANPWLNDLTLAGLSDGMVTAELGPGKTFYVGNLSAVGSIATKEGKIAVERSGLRFENSKNGLSGDLELRLKDGGQLTASFASPVAAGLSLPEQGDFRVELKDLSTALMAPWLPAATTLAGKISGTGTGRLLPGRRFAMSGLATLEGGRLRLANSQGVLDLRLRAVSADWNWHGETVEGNLALTLTEYGEAKGSFRLPLSAAFPLTIKPDGPIQGALTGKVREKGLLSAFFPELVQESQGDLDFTLGLGGIWKEPRLTGKVALKQASGYIPRAGIRLKNVTLSAVLKQELIRIETFRADSGNGYLSGTAELQMKGGKLAAYSGSISGQDFQTIFFPELQVVGTPKLTFAGTGEKLTVRGEVKLPQLHVNGKQRSGAITPSKDVIVAGRKVPEEKKMPMELDIQVRLLLGDSVLVKAQGIDAQLGGGMELHIQGLEKIRSKGEIKIVKGRYKTYGINLEIVRGTIYYAGGSITQPTLDILALRTIGEIKAGVTVEGTLRAPLVKLYSEPAMPDVDILAYIVLGHPLEQAREQAGLLTQAAGMLLSAGQSASLQEQLKNRLGLSTLELQSGNSRTSYMGYKPIEPAAQAERNGTAQTEGLSQTILTVGKYLTPQLYISYGRSIFTGENRFLLRYDIFRNWQIETQTGTESGADLYYKIEFN